MLTSLLCIGSLVSQAQYYNSAFGKNGAVLRSALHTIISSGHTVGTYADLWTDYYSTDNKGGNILWDIYSDIPGGTPAYVYTLGTDQCSGSSGPEGTCYNREHVWPATYFADGPPMYTDLQQIYPTDGYVNNKHSNLPYGKVNSATWTSQNGCKLGSSNTYPGSGLDVFEPIDSFKGDIARIYFYMSTRYLGEDAGWTNWEMANGADLTPAAITVLLAWHHLDPVSQKEIDRNNAAFAIQGNRNPFVDYPVFADCIWGTSDCTSLGLNNAMLNHQIKVFPNPSSSVFHIDATSMIHMLSCHVYSITGQELNIQLSDSNELNLQSYPSGTYLVRILSKEGEIKKVIVKD